MVSMVRMRGNRMNAKCSDYRGTSLIKKCTPPRTFVGP